MSGGWFDKSRCPIGIDIGAHTVRMLQLQERGGSRSVVAAAEAPLPQDLPEPPAERVAVMAALLRQMIESQPFQGRQVVSTLPATALQYKNLRVPKMMPEEMASAVAWEANDRLGIGAGTQIQFVDAGEVRQGEDLRREIILMAADENTVQEHVDTLLAAGFSPLAIDCVPAALARAAEQACPTCEQELASVVIDAGYSSSKVLIQRGGRVLFFKLIELGGKQLDKAIAEKLKMPVEEAAQLRQRLSDKGGDGDEALYGSTRRETVERALFESLRPIAGELAREVGLCLRYYSVTFRGRRPETAHLVGGGAYDPQLARVLAEDAGLQIQVARPLSGIDCSATAGLLDSGREHSEWTVAVGLALRNTGKASARKRGAA